MKEPAILVFGSGAQPLVERLVAECVTLFPQLNLLVVSEFPPSQGRWIPYRPGRTTRRNLERIRADISDFDIRYSAILLDPSMPYWALRSLGLRFTHRVLVFNEHLNHFTLHPRSAVSIARHAAWRLKSFLRRETRPGGDLYTWLWRLGRPEHLRRPWFYRLAQRAGARIEALKRSGRAHPLPELSAELPEGISVVIPTRNGRELIARLLPSLLSELRGLDCEVIVIDNGSDDGTAEWLAREQPNFVTEVHEQPLAFAAAVNRGIAKARYRFVCTLNNDMILRSGFFPALRRAFQETPDLFCATAQIFFPEGQRREETGKAVMPQSCGAREFPLRCDEPLPSEEGSYVLYGSGGCSLYDTAKLCALGGFGETFRPAYVEDLDLGFRAWQQRWPTVFVAAAQAIHAHRSTTGRYYSAEQLETVVNVNYLRFLARSVADPELFRTLWNRATWRLNLLAAAHVPYEPAIAVLREASSLVEEANAPRTVWPDRLTFAAGSGDIAVFPGRGRSGPGGILIASPHLPFPLSHGGAVRMFNLMSRAAKELPQVLVCFVEDWAPPAEELLAICAEVIFVRRQGSHARRETDRPEVVEEYASEPFQAALQLANRKWSPAVVQLELTQMAQYIPDCSLAKTVLVEHDITCDLFDQMLARKEEWEVRQQYERWLRFEHEAWKLADAVVVMSRRDEEITATGQPKRIFRLPNGVDIERFTPRPAPEGSREILFLGSFAHHPNLRALDFFFNQAWPLLSDLGLTFHIIAGSRHEYHLDRYERRDAIRLEQPGIRLEGFVSDVRPAYAQAQVVIAPLLVSAGTNIKVLEAMAMGKAIVSTSAGVHGLELTPGEEFLLAETGEETASAIRELFRDGALRAKLERNARRRAVETYSWDEIAKRQSGLYRDLIEAPRRNSP